jgi:hypothetical protein
MNIVTPLIDRGFKGHVYGHSKAPASKKAKAEEV